MYRRDSGQQMTCEDANDGAEFEEHDAADGPWDHDDDSPTLCPECGYEGKLREFIVPVVSTPASRRLPGLDEPVVRNTSHHGDTPRSVILYQA
jgi:hypothetical protein